MLIPLPIRTVTVGVDMGGGDMSLACGPSFAIQEFGMSYHKYLQPSYRSVTVEVFSMRGGYGGLNETQ